MQDHISSNVSQSESYAIEIDGKIRSIYAIFQDALREGFELRHKFPHSQIEIHDANIPTRAEE